MAQKRNRRRRRRGRGSFGPILRALSVILTAVVIVAALTLFFKVDSVSVSGNSRYTAEEIRRVCGVEAGDNLILLDKYQIAKKLYTELPYITDVSIRRQLPDGLVVEVTETVASMTVEGAGAWWLVSAGGKVLEAVDEETAKGYLLLRGVDAGTPVIGQQLAPGENSALSAQRLVELMRELSERGMLAQTKCVDASDGEKLVLLYDGRFEAEMFYDADLAFKLDCLRAVVNELEPNETGIIRMTMDDENEVRLIPYAQGEGFPAPWPDGEE